MYHPWTTGPGHDKKRYIGEIRFAKRRFDVNLCGPDSAVKSDDGATCYMWI